MPGLKLTFLAFYNLFYKMEQGISCYMNANTRDQQELAHFESLSHTWWDEQGPFRILHKITPLRMAFIKEKITIQRQLPERVSLPFKGLRILDVGCGGGLLCEPLSRLGAEVVGIDPLEENIKVARDHADQMGLNITYRACAIFHTIRSS